MGLIDALLEPAPAGTVATTPQSEADVVGPNNIGQTMLDFYNTQKAKSPLYHSVGENLGEDVLYDRVDAITGERRNSPDVANIPLVPEGYVTELYEAVMSPNPEEPPEETAVRGKAIETGMQDPEVAPAMEALVTENPNADVAAVTATYSAAKSDAIVKKVETSGGWTEQFQGAWDNFTDKVDLFTLGTALMATSGNGQPLTANLGMAIAAGASAKQSQVDRGVAADAASRKESREEREVVVKEQNASVDLANAITRRLEAQTAATGTGLPTKPPQSHHKARASEALALLGIDKEKVEGHDGVKVDPEAVVDGVARQIQVWEMQATPAEQADPSFQRMLAKKATEDFMLKYSRNKEMFGTDIHEAR
jgi:hypothetical protein